MNVKEIVREAKQFMEASSDHKCWVTKGEMLALIAAEAQIVRNEHDSGIYVTEVTFEGIHFFHTNFHSLIPINPILH